MGINPSPTEPFIEQERIIFVATTCWYINKIVLGSTDIKTWKAAVKMDSGARISEQASKRRGATGSTSSTKKRKNCKAMKQLVRASWKFIPGNPLK